MFCNQCGKENKDGMKFCVQCGSALGTTAKNEKIMDGISKASAIIKNSSNKKGTVIAITSLVLILIVFINIFSVHINAFDVKIRNEEINANANGIYETNSFIYYVGDGLYRANKAMQYVERISNKEVQIVAATSNEIYCVSDGTCYKVSDKKPELKTLGDICISSSGNYFFLKDKCHYELVGGLYKELNSEKYSTAQVRLADFNNISISQADLYKDHIYILYYDSDKGKDYLVRVSLSNGKQEVLSTEEISKFAFSGNYIVCASEDGGFFRMDLRGKNAQEYTSIGKVNASNFFCANGYVYYSYGNKLYNFSVDGGAAQELKCKHTYLSGISSGLAYASGNELTIYDYDGNEIAVMKP